MCLTVRCINTSFGTVGKYDKMACPHNAIVCFSFIKYIPVHDDATFVLHYVGLRQELSHHPVVRYNNRN